LHQADRTRAGASVGLEFRLLVDHRGDQRRIEAVVTRVPAHDLLVAKRVPEPLPPGRLRTLSQPDRQQHTAGEHDHREEAPHAVSLPTTSATKASSSASVPSLTYA